MVSITSCSNAHCTANAPKCNSTTVNRMGRYYTTLALGFSYARTSTEGEAEPRRRLPNQHPFGCPMLTSWPLAFNEERGLRSRTKQRPYLLNGTEEEDGAQKWLIHYGCRPLCQQITACRSLKQREREGERERQRERQTLFQKVRSESINPSQVTVPKRNRRNARYNEPISFAYRQPKLDTITSISLFLVLDCPSAFISEAANSIRPVAEFT